MRLEDIRFGHKLMERLWSQVDTSGACWIWTGERNTYGYGVLPIHLLSSRGKRSRIGTHRLSYMLANGAVDDDLCVLHRCDTRPCARPSHLFEGTRAENVEDMDTKGRRVSLRGFSVNTAKLDEEKVREIRTLRLAGVSGPKIGAQFGISAQMVYDICAGKYWRHV